MGEPAILMGILNKVKSAYAVDRRRVYVTGISAGGAMASIMAACYSNVFAAVMVHWAACTRAPPALLTAAIRYSWAALSIQGEGQGWLALLGSPRGLMPTMVFHGTADIVVNPVNGEQTVQQFLRDANDFGDDGLDNDSVRCRFDRVVGQTVPYRRRFTSTPMWPTVR